MKKLLFAMLLCVGLTLPAFAEVRQVQSIKSWVGPCHAYGFPNQSTNIFADSYTTGPTGYPIPEAGFTCQATEPLYTGAPAGSFWDVYVVPVAPGATLNINLVPALPPLHTVLAIANPNVDGQASFVYTNLNDGRTITMKDYTIPSTWGSEEYVEIWVGVNAATDYGLFLTVNKTACSSFCQPRDPRPFCNRAGVRAGTCSASAGPSCVITSANLCLNTSRFSVAVAWRTADGRSGNGSAVALTSDTGYFWFFSAGNVEVVVKVVDGRTFNGHFWVFAGGLTNVDASITVTDTQTGTTKTYRNQQGVAFQPIQDVVAF